MPSTITYAQNSPEATTTPSTSSKITERMVLNSDELQDRLNTLAGIWIQAQNIKRSLGLLTPPERTNEEKAIEKIILYSAKYDVSPKELHAIVKCESQFNPNANLRTSREDSWGWVQINTKVHPVTISQAKDLDYSIDFLAKHWSDGHKEMWYNCAKKANLL